MFFRTNLLIRTSFTKFNQTVFHSNKNVKLDEHKAQTMAKGLPKKRPIKGVNHIIVVSSGKGGVGKSTTAVNLATAMKTANPSKTIGLLDTDVFGPSIPLMMNLHETPLLTDDNLMIPLINYGVKCMSMGFLIEEGAPVIWRGLMVMQALEKLLRQVFWDSIDYLIVDTPPGTGDTHLSLIQNVPISGIVLVTTPQTASLQVTKRGAVMYKKLNVPIIGIVENMSFVKCNSCSNSIRVFGDGTEGLATEINTKILQRFPLENNSDLPFVVSNPKSDISKSYVSLGEEIIRFVDEKERENTSKVKL